MQEQSLSNHAHCTWIRGLSSPGQINYWPWQHLIFSAALSQLVERIEVGMAEIMLPIPQPVSAKWSFRSMHFGRTTQNIFLYSFLSWPNRTLLNLALLAYSAMQGLDKLICSSPRKSNLPTTATPPFYYCSQPLKRDGSQSCSRHQGLICANVLGIEPRCWRLSPRTYKVTRD